MLVGWINKYIDSGGIPDALKYPEIDIHKSLYDDILYRDIATRYQIENVMSLKELSFYLMSNISSLVSFNKLKELLKLGSVNTVKSYIDYLQNSWLFFAINKYAYSVKEQQIASKKIYSIDTGLAKKISFSFSENKGKLMENAVFIHLKRKNKEIFYYKTIQGYEVDFYISDENLFLQVAQNFDSENVKERELRAIVAAAKERKSIGKLTIITERERYLVTIDNFNYEWLLQS